MFIKQTYSQKTKCSIPVYSLLRFEHLAKMCTHTSEIKRASPVMWLDITHTALI